MGGDKKKENNEEDRHPVLSTEQWGISHLLCCHKQLWKWKWKSLSSFRLFATHGMYSPWDSPGQNTGVSSLSLLQEIFPTQESNPGLLHCRWIFYRLSHEIHQATAFKNFTTDIPGVVLARKQAQTVSSLLEATFQTVTQGSEMQAKSNSLAGRMNLTQGWAGFCKQVQEGSWGASLSSSWWLRKAAIWANNIFSPLLDL